jgi:hypothetical protein
MNLTNMNSRFGCVAVVATSMLLACGGGGEAKTANDAKDEGLPANHKCGEHDKVQQYDLHDDDGQDHFAPCAQTGKEDFSGNVHLDTTPEGIKITIRATDDDVNEGKLGSDLKGRDAMIVFPKGRDKKGVEIPLVRTKNGYKGEKVIPYADLDKLTDEGTKLEVSIYDNDDNHKNGGHEELKVSIAISAGKSCEKAMDENPQEIMMGKKSGPDLTNEQLGRPMQNSAFIQHCGLPDSSNADICVAVKKGKPLGVSVSTAPMNNKVAACIDKATRKLAFPPSEKLDVVKQHF